MNKYAGKPNDIHTRIYRFIIGCFRDVVRNIPKSPANNPIISQISSSLTSIGANDQEADAAGSQRDFVAKYAIVKKETKETLYWLSFIGDSQMIDISLVRPYIQECKEILLIISKILINTKLRSNS